jgi:hypothetical protein
MPESEVARGVEIWLLIRVQVQQDSMGGGSGGCFLGCGTVGLEVELVGRVPSLDRVHRLEHGNVEHGLTTCIRDVDQLLFDANGLRFGVPVHNDVAAGGTSQQHREAGARDPYREVGL